MLSTKESVNFFSIKMSNNTFEAGIFSKLRINSSNLFFIFSLNLIMSSELTEFLSYLSFIMPLLAKYAISRFSGLNLSIS